MGKGIRSKKGVSPLIATVLLIAFAVALGAIVMNWGREYIEDTQASVEMRQAETNACTFDVSLSLVELGEKPCVDSDNPIIFYAIIENSDNADITGFKATLFGNNLVADYEYNTTIKRVESKIIAIPLGPYGMSGADKVSIIPKVRIKGAQQDTYCVNSKLEIDDIPTSPTCNG